MSGVQYASWVSVSEEGCRVNRTIKQAADDVTSQVTLLWGLYVTFTVEEDRVAPDSFPSSSLGGGSPSNELDDDGTPLPQHSDPTYRAVELRDQSAHRVVCREIEQALYRVRRDLDVVLSKARTAAKPPPKIDQATNDRSIWCTNHQAHGMQEPRRTDPKAPLTRAPKAGLCRFCEDWKRDAYLRHAPTFEDGTPNLDYCESWPLLPPGEVLEARERGPITSKVLEDCGLGGGPTARQVRLSKKQRKRSRKVA